MTAVKFEEHPRANAADPDHCFEPAFGNINF
jgi:hypothetical protein